MLQAFPHKFNVFLHDYVEVWYRVFREKVE